MNNAPSRADKVDQPLVTFENLFLFGIAAVMLALGAWELSSVARARRAAQKERERRDSFSNPR